LKGWVRTQETPEPEKCQLTEGEMRSQSKDTLKAWGISLKTVEIASAQDEDAREV
jgi:hypothetical protein